VVQVHVLEIRTHVGIRPVGIPFGNVGFKSFVPPPGGLNIDNADPAAVDITRLGQQCLPPAVISPVNTSLAMPNAQDTPEDPQHGPPPPEVIEVDEETVSCDGGDGALGHPRVFLHMNGAGFVDCPYCDRRFILSDDA